jgi:RND superfamily putative drug exporter
VPDAPTTRTPRVDPNRNAAAAPPTPTPPPSTKASRRAESQRGSTQNREIESWLGELRSNGTPSAEPTRAMPEQRPAPRKAQAQTPPVDAPTTAIPAQSPQESGATEKIPTQASDDELKRRGDDANAADLLRREGRR